MKIKLFLLLLITTTVICISTNCNRKNQSNRVDTIRVEKHTIYKDSIIAIQVPGETIIHAFNYDSIKSILQTTKQSNVIIYKDIKSNMQLSARFDSLNNKLLLQCDALGRIDSAHVQEKNTIINTFMQQQAKAHESLLAKIEHKIEKALLGLLWKILLLLIIWEGIKLLFKYVLGGFWINALKLLKGFL